MQLLVNQPNPQLERLMQALEVAEIALAEADASGNMTPTNVVMSQALTHLVKTVAESDKVSHAEMTNFLDNVGTKRLKKLHDHLSEAEAQMELHVAQEFCEEPNLARADLKRFIYWNNYEELTRREAEAFKRVFDKTNFEETPRFVFVGSGPLPLTGVLIQEHFHNSSVVCWDIDKDAVDISTSLVTNKLGVKNFEIKHGTGLEEQFGANDILIVAALVQPKQPIIEAALSSGVKFVATRGARGASRVLYENPDMRELHNAGLLGVGFADSGKTHNEHGEMVNDEHVINTLQITATKELVRSLPSDSPTFMANKRSMQSASVLG